MTNFKKFYEQAIKLLDDLNELMSDIDWHLQEEQSESLEEYNACSELYYAIEDTEAELSQHLYDTWIEEINILTTEEK